MIEPPLTPNAIAYAWERLWALAGAEELTIPRVYGPPHTPLPAPGVIISPAAAEAWEQLIQLPPNSLNWLPAEALFPPGYPRPFDDALPVLFWGETAGKRPPVRVREDGSILFAIDLIATILFMLTRWEEIVIAQRDSHDRLPATASVAYRQGFLDQPVVDRYAIILQAWLQKRFPSWQRPQRGFSLRLSHDIDHLRRFLHPNEALRQTIHDLWRQKRPVWALEDIRDFLMGRLWLDHNPYLSAMDNLAQLDEQAGYRGVFYIMAAVPAAYDEGFPVHTPALVRRLRELSARGHIIGIHPGYHTYLDPIRYQAEKARLETTLGRNIHHARQHYLRFRVPDTWRIAAQAGVVEDATLGYHDHEGFRCGTAHPFPVFDLIADHTLPVREHPLHVMDSTLITYRGLTPAQGLARLRHLARRVQEVGGEMHLLWHNTLTPPNRRPWMEVYRRFVTAPAPAM